MTQPDPENIRRIKARLAEAMGITMEDYVQLMRERRKNDCRQTPLRRQNDNSPNLKSRVPAQASKQTNLSARPTAEAPHVFCEVPMSRWIHQAGP